MKDYSMAISCTLLNMKRIAKNLVLISTCGILRDTNNCSRYLAQPHSSWRLGYGSGKIWDLSK